MTGGAGLISGNRSTSSCRVAQRDRSRCGGSTDHHSRVQRDYQWIHTDPERARATPFGGTLAHGCFMLALAPRMLAELIDLSALLQRRRRGPLGTVRDRIR
jgi:MaoC like domain